VHKNIRKTAVHYNKSRLIISATVHWTDYITYECCKKANTKTVIWEQFFAVHHQSHVHDHDL